MNGAWYRRYPADFLHSTSMLSCEEKGAYSVLIDLMYERGGPIPDDAAWIARLCGCSQRKWTQTLRPALIAAGKLNVADGKLSNGRVLYETHRANERIANARVAGRKGGTAKANNATINQHESFDYNTLSRYTPTPFVSPADKAPINTDDLWEINDLDKSALPPAPIDAEPIADLSRVYRPDKPPIIESKFNEINAPPLADSGLRKERKQASNARTAARETDQKHAAQAGPLPGQVFVGGVWIFPPEPPAPKFRSRFEADMAGLGTPDRTTGDATINGFDVGVVVHLACKAARIDLDRTSRIDQSRPVRAWLAEGIDTTHILGVIRRRAAGANYKPPSSLAWFGPAICDPSASRAGVSNAPSFTRVTEDTAA